MITLRQLLEHYGFAPSGVKLVRHSNAEYDILDMYRRSKDRFEAYQCFQKPGRFSGADRIVVFAPSLGTTALFLGVWDVGTSKENVDLTKGLHEIIDDCGFPQSWHKEIGWYDLQRNPAMDELSERLVIDWGKGAHAWIQNMKEGRDKEILELKGKNSIGDFVSYDQVQLSFYDLKKIVSHSSSNSSFVSALKAVNGIYLIRDTSAGRLYVGSAYGENGIFGRWSSYAESGHGGNKNLKGLDSTNFEFSILEIVPPRSSLEEVVRREMRWQEKLGTRDFSGLNKR